MTADMPPLSHGEPRQHGGFIGLFARHPTAANLVLAMMILAGVTGLARLNRQFFPNFGIDVVTVNVEWPGATAADVDANIVEALEPELRFLDGVDRVRSTSVDGLARISIEFEAGADMQAALSDVESAVDQVTTLPEASERPEVRRVVNYDAISSIVIAGPYPERALRDIAQRMRDELLDRGADRVVLNGVREAEIAVEVPATRLRELDLTLGDVALAIRQSAQDVPSGDIGNGARQIRALGLETDAGGVGAIAIRALDDGRILRLRDVAHVADGFEEGGRTVFLDRYPAVELNVERSLTADALTVSALVDDYLAEARATLPPNLAIVEYRGVADLIQDRIDLLLWNGLSGLILVLVTLFVFLNGRVAFWVAVGIPASLMATLAVMLVSDQSINMLSLFGLIMAIGIVVDDAIVVGEHAEARHAAGLSPMDAAVTGAQRMLAPVSSSTLTTVAAFLPLLLISGVIGEIIQAIPLVVIAVLIASLIECFLVLPAHMRDALAASEKDQPRGLAFWLRTRFDNAFNGFRDGPFRRAVETAIAWRYSVVAGAVGALIVCIGLVATGRVGFTFFPTPEADRIFANVQMASGSSRAATEAMLVEAEAAAFRAIRQLGGDPDDLLKISLRKVGTTVGGGFTAAPGSADTVGGIEVELIPADRRAIRTDQLIAAWRAEVRPAAGLESLAIRAAQGGPPGRDVDVRLYGDDLATLKAAAEELKLLLSGYPGVSDIEDNLPYGTPEIILEVTPRGRALGFTTSSVGEQVRNALEGAIARRFARGEDEVTIRVQLPRAELTEGVLDRLWLRAPSGQEVALAEVVSAREEVGFASVRREDGRREVMVTAEIDSAVNSTGRVVETLTDSGDLAAIAGRYSLEYRFAGRAEEQAETFADMGLGAMLGLAGIYIILAWVFASYTRPLSVIAVIPLGFIGAVLGHLALGYNLTMLSMIAMIGLSGIVINDSIVLVTTIDERRRRQTVFDAVVQGTCERLRAVLLTSLTTIGGLAPLLFETSLQAQFLIPMALTIVAGLAVATVLILFVVPSLVAIQGDFSLRAARPGLAIEALGAEASAE